MTSILLVENRAFFFSLQMEEALRQRELKLVERETQFRLNCKLFLQVSTGCGSCALTVGACADA
jgi:hypothetical protein